MQWIQTNIQLPNDNDEDDNNEDDEEDDDDDDEQDWQDGSARSVNVNIEVESNVISKQLDKWLLITASTCLCNLKWLAFSQLP